MSMAALAVAPEGSMTGYIKRFHAGYTAELDTMSVARVIRKILSDWQNNTLKRTSDFEGIANVFDGKRIMQLSENFSIQSWSNRNSPIPSAGSCLN
jgi:hypothetical protein